MASSGKANWLIPTGLVLLSAVPVIAGTVRLAQLGGGAAITPENARFFAAPLPVAVHIVSVTIYSLLGAFQFSPGFRKRKPGWHRAAGKLLVVAGLLSALTGLWMSKFYEWPRFDGVYLYAIRLVVGTAMAVSLVLGVVTIRRRDIQAHRAWMMRAYALGLGAGTQVFTHLPYFLIPSIQGELARTICMASAWVLNAIVAEWLIASERRGSKVPRSTPEPRPPHTVPPGSPRRVGQTGWSATRQ